MMLSGSLRLPRLPRLRAHRRDEAAHLKEAPAALRELPARASRCIRVLQVRRLRMTCADKHCMFVARCLQERQGAVQERLHGHCRLPGARRDCGLQLQQPQEVEQHGGAACMAMPMSSSDSSPCKASGWKNFDFSPLTKAVCSTFFHAKSDAMPGECGCNKPTARCSR